MNNLNYGTLLVGLQGLNKGQTLSIIKKNNTLCEVRPNGYKKIYSIPHKYIKLRGEEIEYPRCQEIWELWIL